MNKNGALSIFQLDISSADTNKTFYGVKDLRKLEILNLVR
jgi:hypothetical protein